MMSRQDFSVFLCFLATAISLMLICSVFYLGFGKQCLDGTCYHQLLSLLCRAAFPSLHPSPAAMFYSNALRCWRSWSDKDGKTVYSIFLFVSAMIHDVFPGRKKKEKGDRLPQERNSHHTPPRLFSFSASLLFLRYSQPHDPLVVKSHPKKQYLFEQTRNVPISSTVVYQLHFRLCTVLAVHSLSYFAGPLRAYFELYCRTASRSSSTRPIWMLAALFPFSAFL